jgi:hypothetical protein
MVASGGEPVGDACRVDGGSNERRMLQRAVRQPARRMARPTGRGVRLQTTGDAKAGVRPRGERGRSPTDRNGGRRPGAADNCGLLDPRERDHLGRLPGLRSPARGLWRDGRASVRTPAGISRRATRGRRHQHQALSGSQQVGEWSDRYEVHLEPRRHVHQRPVGLDECP